MYTSLGYLLFKFYITAHFVFKISYNRPLSFFEEYRDFQRVPYLSGNVSLFKKGFY